MTTNSGEEEGLGRLIFKMKFLRVMLPSMTLGDADQFSQACYHFRSSTAFTAEDIRIIDQLYEKFEFYQKVEKR